MQLTEFFAGNAGTLALIGGIAAAAAAGWRQLCSFLGYLSSAIIVRAHLHGPVTRGAAYHLRTQWRIIPSGLITVYSIFADLKTYGTRGAVPFKILNTNTLFYSKGRLVLLQLQGEKSTLFALRGNVNLEELIACSMKDFTAFLANTEQQDAEKSKARSNRYEVVRVIGKDRHSYNTREDGDSSAELATSSPKSGGLSEGSSTFPGADCLLTAVDDSFVYPRDEYIWNIEDDPFKGLYYAPNVYAQMAKIDKWFQMKDWYAERQIPWRRGLMLEGPGGTGKSSLAKAMARRLGIPVYQYFLSTLTDNEFMQRWDRMVTPCIALCDDIDAVFHGREPANPNVALTFDCFLNVISGVTSANGVLLIVNTNRAELVDPALGVSTNAAGLSSRPGRIDVVLHLGIMDQDNRCKMARHVLSDWPEEAEKMCATEGEYTPAQFNELCVQRAVELLQDAERTS